MRHSAVVFRRQRRWWTGVYVVCRSVHSPLPPLFVRSNRWAVHESSPGEAHTGAGGEAVSPVYGKASRSHQSYPHHTFDWSFGYD